MLEMKNLYIQWLRERMLADADEKAIIFKNQTYTRSQLLEEMDHSRDLLIKSKIEPGAVVALIGDYSFLSIARFLALIEHQCVVVPHIPISPSLVENMSSIAQIKFHWDQKENLIKQRETWQEDEPHSLILQLRKKEHSGLILFSSGSEGNPKAILHDFEQLLKPLQREGKSMVTLSFLLFDHIGGIQTMFHTLSQNGCLVIPNSRSGSEISKTISKHGVELLPTSPTFLNLLLLENKENHHQLDSIKLVTYGTEAMPERTLQQAIKAMPHARFKQTYGSSELGILRSRSAANDSLMIQVGGNEQEVKAKDGRLFILNRGSMLGYLNAKQPFDEDGWFDTGDAIIQEGDFYRIIGRESDLINVGGQKVFPIEVEEVIAKIPEIEQVTIRSEPHLLLGETVVAEVVTPSTLSSLEIKRLIRSYCKDRLQTYMIPSKIYLVEKTGVTDRFKKERKSSQPN